MVGLSVPIALGGMSPGLGLYPSLIGTILTGTGITLECHGISTERSTK